MNVLLITAKKAVAVGGIAIWTNHYLSQCKQHDLHCTLVNTEKKTDKTFGGFSELSRTHRIISDLKSTLAEGRYHVAHLNTSCGPYGLFRDYAIAKRIRRKGIPVVIHYHCDIPNWINTRSRRTVLQKLARLGALNLVLCESSRAYLEQLGVEAVKIPNFITPQAVADHPKEIRDTLNRIFFVGRVSVNKGAAELFELARRFPDKNFVLAGGVVPPVDGWEVPANLRLIGKISSSKVTELSDGADLFLFPSHSEGFSLALMEAMARGLPCVAYDSVGANGDMLAEDCGVTVPYGDVDGLAEAIRRLEDPALRKALSENAVAKVRDHYTTDAVLTSLHSLYETIL